jgi:hypothetical protein
MPPPFARLSAFDLQTDTRVVTAHSSRLDRVSGDGWLAVDDAAMAFDPLSSQGLTHALASGIRAGEALDCRLTNCAVFITVESSGGRSPSFDDAGTWLSRLQNTW